MFLEGIFHRQGCGSLCRLRSALQNRIGSGMSGVQAILGEQRALTKALMRKFFVFTRSAVELVIFYIAKRATFGGRPLTLGIHK